MTCVFCKIGNGEKECFKVYEDDLIVALLDIHPCSPGHILVIPKEHYESIFDTPNEVLGRINIVCKKMGLLCKEKLGATGVNTLNASGKDAQQSVFHLHFHVIPRYEEDGLDLWFHGESNKVEDVKEVYDKLNSKND